MNIGIVFGTRPEFLKLNPIISLAKTHKDVRVIIINTAQHREMLDDLLRYFNISTDVDLDIMTDDQGLPELCAKVINQTSSTIKKLKLDWLLVQGDTTTAMAVSICGFYLKVPVVHIEAGLRSYDLSNPFPEEFNRKVISSCASIHFSPTKRAADNLIKEGVDQKNIHIVGNTIVDQIHLTKEKLKDVSSPMAEAKRNGRRCILVTAHRRENHGEKLEEVFSAILELAEKHKNNVEFFYPVHPNPNVLEPATKMLSSLNNIHLLKPVGYIELLKLISDSYFILSDSGGIQEEAPSFKKPVLILRETTERPECVECGCGRLVGTDKKKIITEFEKLLIDSEYIKRTKMTNPFGDGKSSEVILSKLLEKKN